MVQKTDYRNVLDSKVKKLRIPIRPRNIMRIDINKIDKKISRWKGTSLSRDSRLTLVNSVLFVIPLYGIIFYQLLA